jgi:lipopolysaccharide transport system ATP-binding protein
MSDDIAIKVDGLSKCYHINDTPRDRLKQFVLPYVRQFFGARSKNYYREFWALRDISFEIRKGETFGIIGLNGSGKSTLLKLVCGVLEKTCGTIKTTGRIAALLELGTGFNPEFTGRENVYLNASVLGLSEKEVDAKFERIAQFAEIGEFIDRPVKTYSSGMYVRLAFSVMANVDADLLIIDEALAVGDAVFNQKCMRFLREFKQKGGTLLFVSHSMGVVVNLCDRAIYLHKGQVKENGLAKDVCEKYLAIRYGQSQQKIPIRRTFSGDADQSKSHYTEGDREDAGFKTRLTKLESMGIKNDIRVFDIAEAKNTFGTNGADVVFAGIEDLQGNRLSWVTGGEIAVVIIQARILTTCSNLVFGFNIKDRLGQVLVGQNSYIDTCLSPVSAKSGDLVGARFIFRLPLFPRGTYAVDVAVADGSPPDVVQLQWLHEAFLLESQTSNVVTGLLGMIFEEIEVKNWGSESV